MSGKVTPGPAGESLYRRVIVPLVRGIVALVVVGFIVSGAVIGAAALDMEEGDAELDPVECARRGYSGDNADDCPLQQVEEWNVALAVGGGGAGAAVGLAAGLLLTFTVEVQVTLFLAARKYLAT